MSPTIHSQSALHCPYTAFGLRALSVEMSTKRFALELDRRVGDDLGREHVVPDRPGRGWLSISGARL